MEIPFTVDQFYDVFRDYNEVVWPTQLLLIGLALVGVVLVIKPRGWSHSAVSGILAVLWVWLAVVYHFAFFARINPLAYAFSALSLFGAAVFVWDGLVRRRLRFEWSGSIRSWVGAALIGFGLVVYPVWSWAAGHAYPYTPTFGLPCPNCWNACLPGSALPAEAARCAHTLERNRSSGRFLSWGAARSLTHWGGADRNRPVPTQ